MKTLLLLAGAGQIGIVLSSLFIPRVLKWREQTAALRPLTRQVFWTYAGYILCTNLSFGLLSLLMPDRLLDGTPLARAVVGFISLYWGVRLALQFGVYDVSDAPKGPVFKLADWGFTLLFAFLTLTYGLAVFA